MIRYPLLGEMDLDSHAFALRLQAVIPGALASLYFFSLSLLLSEQSFGRSECKRVNDYMSFYFGHAVSLLSILVGQAKAYSH